MTDQDLSFSWGANNSSRGNHFTNNQSSHNLQQLEMINKREFSDISCTNFSEMISSSPSASSIEEVQVVQMQPTSINDPNVKLLLATLSSSAGGQSKYGLIHQSCSNNFYSSTSSSLSTLATTPKRGPFSHIYPTINVSNFNQTSLLANSSSLDLNLKALDLLNSARFSGSFHQSMPDQLALSKNVGRLSYGCDYWKQSVQMPVLEPSTITHFINGVPEAKRSNINLEASPPQATLKRSRLESRPSCPPFKARKEKLGDRIAALQQLVAPFGKTDTASVLMEAIGYIKFLQDQVEKQCLPYLQSSSNKTGTRTVHRGHAEINGSEERKGDLRSRGLCLVPIPCLSYVTDGGGGVVWPPPNFGGGT
ncbi:hypothetical protein ACH5RR_027396 [Cinchona calisaya]|uniref:BHLH domain-containing protein n=1 Tax=Cinchona calisaya TaxID=153742 RepID=A0ABD2Z5B7_9GENT